MERSSFAAIMGGFLGITTLGGLTLVGGSPEAHQPPPPRPEGDWRLIEPVTYENISIFPVVSSSSQDTTPFLTLEEGLSTGDLVVRQQGPKVLARSPKAGPVYIPK